MSLSAIRWCIRKGATFRELPPESWQSGTEWPDERWEVSLDGIVCDHPKLSTAAYGVRVAWRQRRAAQRERARLARILTRAQERTNQ